MKASLVAWVCLAAAASSAFQQQPVFRTDRTGVIVDVGVLKDGRPLPGLTRRDFRIMDSGAAQEILDVSQTEIPLDISLLVDASYSMNGKSGDLNSGSRHLPAGEWLRAGIGSVAAILTRQDSLRLMPFSTGIRQVGTAAQALDTTGRSGRAVAGRTALFDAILAAAIRAVEPGRRHVVVVLTDGTDTASTVPEKVRNIVLDRSEATIHMVACGDRDHRIHSKETRVKIAWNFPFGGYDWILKDAAERTGGSFYTSESEADFARSLAAALAEIRARYLISFQPRGVSGAGWHSLQVELPGHPGVEIRARKGYFAR